MSGDFAKLITDSGRQADNVLKFSRWINYRIPISTENVAILVAREQRYYDQNISVLKPIDPTV